jgi:hypothetical protein
MKNVKMYSKLEKSNPGFSAEECGGISFTGGILGPGKVCKRHLKRSPAQMSVKYKPRKKKSLLEGYLLF